MTKAQLPAVICDHEAGCDQYSEDYEAQGVSSVTFYDHTDVPTIFRPTKTEPTPEWTRVGDEDFCPEHRDDAMKKLDEGIDKLHGPGAADALNRAIADGSIFGD